ncbi:MAG TPA: protease pro-enzyme activation domain-containing protein [bacterium]|nr:protease pro-enzyme activation domain-containing protein [bacterium]
MCLNKFVFCFLKSFFRNSIPSAAVIYQWKIFQKPTLPAVIVTLSAFLICSSSSAAGVQQLHGHVPHAVQTAPLVGHLESARQLHIAVSLPLRNEETIQYLLKVLYDPQSPDYRKFLAPKKCAEMFGATKLDYQAVVNFLKAKGLAVTTEHANRIVIDAVGSAEVVEKIFNVTLNKYKRSDNTEFYAPDREPSIEINVPVLHVSGLDNYGIPHPANVAIKNEKSLKFQKPSVSSGLPAPNFGTGPGWCFFPHGNTYIGNDFRNLYLPGLLSAQNGSGQKIALLEYDGYSQADITNYQQLTGLPSPQLTPIPVDQSGNNLYSVNGADEVILDIDMAWAMAPNAVILSYEENPAYPPVDVFSKIQTDNLAQEISCSWSWVGLPDVSVSQIFNLYALQGQTFFQAAGDTGAYVDGDPLNTPPNPMCASSLMTVVGGTQLTTTGTGTNGSLTPHPTPGVGNYVSETTWNDANLKPLATMTPNTNAVGGGGICSGPTPLPIPTYQVPFINANNLGSLTYRNIPDVSLVADNLFTYGFWQDPNTGIIYDGVGLCGAGTSAAAPLWTGFMAIVNQQAASSGNIGPIGFANPYLYTLAASPTPYYNDFHDIKDGSNNNYWHPTTTPIYPAVTGYDLATGLGSINNNLLNALVGEMPTWTPTPTPTFLTCSSGQPGNTWTAGATGTPDGGSNAVGSVEDGIVFDPGTDMKMWIIGGGKVWSSTNGTNWTTQSSPAFLTGRTGQQSVTFNGKIWVMGGVVGSTYESDVWSSSDGVNWTEATGTAAFGARSYFSLTVYNGYMWVIAGQKSGGLLLNDVWYSNDGVNWTEATASAAFPIRAYAPCVVFNNQMYLIGGAESSVPGNDIWTSTNGSAWAQVSTSGSVFSGRYSAHAVVCGNVLWLIGGDRFNGHGVSPDYDVWVTLDGVSWTQTNTSNPFDDSTGSAVSYNGAVWALTTSPSGTWTWNNGCCQLPTFTPTPTPTFTPTFAVCSSGQPGNAWTAGATGTPDGGSTVVGTVEDGVVFDPGTGPKMWLINGSGVWSSPNGTNWTNQSSPLFLTGRTGQQSVTFNGKIWVMGGVVGSTYESDVWSSPDGVNWTEATGSAAFGARSYFSMVVYNGYMWVIAGQKSGSVLLNDAWYSSDGANWTQATSSAAFSVRAWAPCVVFNNQMYLIGGGESSVPGNDIWTSTNGSTWTQVSISGSVFSGRESAHAVVCGNALWVIGGLYFNGHGVSPATDVWVSQDVVHWTETNTSNPFDDSTGSAVPFGGAVWALTTSTSGTWTWSSGCCLLPTPTPMGGLMAPVRGSEVEGIKSTPTFTPSPTPTVSPTPTPIPSNAFTVVAAPNVSRNGQPIQFEMVLGSPGQINLILYTLTGDQVYQTSVAGSVGLNTALWKLENHARSQVASGLYIYSVQVTNESGVQNKIGKVVVIR